MSAISQGGITLICNNKNGSAPMNLLTIEPQTALVFTHGLGTKNGNGYGAWKVRVLDVNGADLSALSPDIQVTQPEDPVTFLIDTLEVFNNSDTEACDVVIEITWEVLSSQVQLVEGTPAPSGPNLPPLPNYPDVVPTFN
jgi:hypothetical protein